MVVINKTEFIFEDGETYYFDIHSREYSGEYHNLFIYRKKEIKRVTRSWFHREITTFDFEYEKVVEDPIMISKHIDTNEIKRDIKRKLISINAHNLKGCDGFIGDVPEEKKKMLTRNSKLDDLLG